MAGEWMMLIMGICIGSIAFPWTAIKLIDASERWDRFVCGRRGHEWARVGTAWCKRCFAHSEEGGRDE